MARQVSSLRIISIAVLLLAQGCVTAPKPSDKASQHIALERWNQCLERFDRDTHHYCDGHRRDVLAAFPGYLGERIDARLNRQVAVRQTNDLMKTRLPLFIDAVRDLKAHETLK